MTSPGRNHPRKGRLVGCLGVEQYKENLGSEDLPAKYRKAPPERFIMDTIINPTQESDKQQQAVKELENKEWIESLDYVLEEAGPELSLIHI